MTEKFASPVSFPVMIDRLFKKMPGQWDDHMHAAIGISGEVGELHNADSRKNIIEECGDLEFYIQAYLNKLSAVQTTRRAAKVEEDSRATHSLGVLLAKMSVCSSDILDLTKKSWVYGKALPERDVMVQLEYLGGVLDSIYILVGTSYEEVVNLNQEKLIGPNGRFKDGFYSDAAAINRADKAAEEANAKVSERKFFGQAQAK